LGTLRGSLRTRTRYDHTAWNPNYADSNGLWTQGLNKHYNATMPWAQPLTIVLAYAPGYCVDACAGSLSNAQCGNAYASSKPVGLTFCDAARRSQRWYFNATTGEVSARHSLHYGCFVSLLCVVPSLRARRPHIARGCATVRCCSKSGGKGRGGSWGGGGGANSRQCSALFL
jgi:hypothetical protein